MKTNGCEYISEGVPGRVSIIIAAYNAEEFIAEAVESVLAQTYLDIECIVVDDGSTDRTGEIVRGYHDRVRYLSQENSERSAARNHGIAAATGAYISFLDADDYLAPEKISEQLVYLGNNPQYDVAYSRVCYFKDTVKRRFYEVQRPTPSGNILQDLLLRNFLVMGSPLLKRQTLAATVGFDTGLSLNEDWDFWLRLAAAGCRFGYVDSAIHLYCRQHADNTSRNRLRMYESKLEVIEHFVAAHGGLLAEKGINTASVQAFHRADYGRGLILHGSVKEGRREIAAAVTVAFPYRWLFKTFSIFSGLFGHRILAFIQQGIRGEL